ncbi:PepSY domain-containing protein [Lysinibacillus endophyticus]|uniref:PepSY domain-containing protein n=1 Tax=Ureibacillus endophyticus TaxID=1978490 RepID=UPI0020A0DE8A|nr:PepSY domain-containing protein [Lysinibacillus endophyticus]MCP1145474.1 PepSY domain-containing protein [Lysinibacillus endophyticus]
MYYGYQNPMYLQNNQRISVQQAQQIALSRVPGQIVHVDLDMDNGVLKYEVYVLTMQNKMYEVKINARTGRIIKVEQENDDDMYDFD